MLNNEEYVYKSFGRNGLETLVTSYHRGDNATLIMVTFKTGWFVRRKCFITFIIRNENLNSTEVPIWKAFSPTMLLEDASPVMNWFCNQMALPFGKPEVTSDLLRELRTQAIQ